MTTGEPWAILLSPISLSLSFALFFSLLIQSFLSFGLSFSYLVSLSFSFLYLPARMYESFPLLESPICSLSSCLYLHLCLHSCSTSLVTSRLPTLLESIPLFLFFLSSYLSFFRSLADSRNCPSSRLWPRILAWYGATTVPSVFFLLSINRIYLPVSASWPFFPLLILYLLLIFKLSFFLFLQRSSLVFPTPRKNCVMSRALSHSFTFGEHSVNAVVACLTRRPRDIPSTLGYFHATPERYLATRHACRWHDTDDWSLTAIKSKSDN